MSTWRETKAAALLEVERAYWSALQQECGGVILMMARMAATEPAHVRSYLRRHGLYVAPPAPVHYVGQPTVSTESAHSLHDPSTKVHAP